MWEEGACFEDLPRLAQHGDLATVAEPRIDRAHPAPSGGSGQQHRPHVSGKHFGCRSVCFLGELSAALPNLGR